ncbi:MAG: hypothetical protein Q8R91_10695 [Candidatus Omnitrophota bacterium]|nr:hypothetical protein [Candidatus Omnitrophota bacterium]
MANRREALQGPETSSRLGGTGATLSTAFQQERAQVMERLERRILDVLQHHQGKDQAITVSELQGLVRMSSRKIRATIARLVTEHRIPIASTVHPPYGFYLITTAEEAKECLAQYWSRVEEVAKRAKILADVVKEQFGVETQLELKFEPPAGEPPA